MKQINQMPNKKRKKKDIQQSVRKFFDAQPDQNYSTKEVCDALKIKDKNLRKTVLTVLIDLKNEGFLNEFQRGTFTLNQQFQNTFVGVVDSTSRGTAYIVVPELETDIYVQGYNMGNALDGDTVEVSIIRRSKRKIEGAITKVIERKTTQFVGTLDVHKKFAFLMIDSPKIQIDLFIPLGKLKGGKTGEKAVGRITSWPKDVDNPYGEIVEVLGEANSNNVEMTSILVKNDFEIKFPKEVVEEAKNVTIDLDQNEVEKRLDCRKKLTITIDPFNAKDFDDALSYEILENGNTEICVHIADVSHYVIEGSATDQEALKRGNSVYLEDRVIPMLPEELSNFACSLRPNEDKFAFSAIFELDQEGNVSKEWFGKTVIRSDRRMTYEEALEIIEGKEDKHQEAILGLDKIAKTIRRKRIQKGALAIESREVSFVLNEEGEPIDVAEKIQNDANRLIEEFMLLANKRVALFVGKVPGEKGSSKEFIYRCHDKPEVEKLNTFSVFIDKFGYDLKFQNIDSVAKKINAFLDQIKNRPEYELIQSMAIRSMSKADYRTGNIGHYGLAFDFYTHFTSPIRRYSDLMVHRILLDKLQGKNKSYGNTLNEICKHLSAQEKAAAEAERESNKFFQAKYMKERVGQQFTGTISGLADFGVFVKMDGNACEGMISLSDLPGDSYYFDRDKFQIVGRQTRYKFNFGDRVLVKVMGVNLAKKQIDLKII